MNLVLSKIVRYGKRRSPRLAFFYSILFLACGFQANFTSHHYSHLLLTGATSPLKGIEPLNISQAYNALQHGSFNEAAQICFLLIRKNQTQYKDPYFILGEVHLQEKLYLSAINYYQQALNHNGEFLIHENNLRLYYNLSEAYYRENRPKEQLQTLETITTQLSLSAENPVEQDYVYKARFLLALAYWGFENKGKSLVHLHAMLRDDYKKVFATLLLAYYYASSSEAEIASDYREHFYNPNSIGNTPHKDQRFTYYYNQFNRQVTELPLTAQGRIDIKPYTSLIKYIQAYEKERLEKIERKRQEDLDFIKSSAPNPEKRQQGTTRPAALSSVIPPSPKPTSATSTLIEIPLDAAPIRIPLEEKKTSPNKRNTTLLKKQNSASPQRQSSASVQRQKQSQPKPTTPKPKQTQKQQESSNPQEALKKLENLIEKIYKDDDTPLFLGRSEP